MFEEWRFDRKHRQEVRVYRRVDQKYRDEISAAKRNGSSADQIAGIESRHQWELELLADEMEWANSQHVMARALYYKVPIPTFDDDNWTESKQLGVRYLSWKGANSVGADIAAVKKRGRDLFFSIATLAISLIGATTGVLGAAIGVLAFVAKKPN